MRIVNLFKISFMLAVAFVTVGTAWGAQAPNPRGGGTDANGGTATTNATSRTSQSFFLYKNAKSLSE